MSLTISFRLIRNEHTKPAIWLSNMAHMFARCQCIGWMFLFFPSFHYSSVAQSECAACSCLARPNLERLQNIFEFRIYLTADTIVASSSENIGDLWTQFSFGKYIYAEWKRSLLTICNAITSIWINAWKKMFNFKSNFHLSINSCFRLLLLNRLVVHDVNKHFFFGVI